MHAALSPRALHLGVLGAAARAITKNKIINSMTFPPCPFTTPTRTLSGRSKILVDHRPHARGSGKALQELLDRREEDRDEEDDTPVATQLQWESPLKVVLYPDPKLRAQNSKVGSFDDSLKKLAEEMFEVMYDDDGVGLAAPQVGVNVRLMVFNETGSKEKRESEVVLVNPRIISSSKDAKVFEEGCLSFPKLYGDVVRPTKVRVTAQDLSGKQFTINIGGFPARIFQHEYDHLQGTLFCDRMNSDVLEELREDLVAMEESFIKENPGIEVQRV